MEPSDETFTGLNLYITLCLQQSKPQFQAVSATTTATPTKTVSPVASTVATAAPAAATVAPAVASEKPVTTIPPPSSSTSSNPIQTLKDELMRMKKDSSVTKVQIANKAEELEKLKYEASESEGGFNAAERKSYESKLAKLKRKLEAEELEKKRQLETAAKKKETTNAAAVEVVPPPQHFTGKKKDMSGKVLSSYHPANVEAVWDAWWTSQGYFTPSNAQEEGEKFVMVIPPPNVTGSLHIGHALTVAIEDSIVRWHRMLGHKTLWLPGTDHAGIATQTVVEKQLTKEWEKDHSLPKNKAEMGREAFLRRVWEWKESKGDTIIGQKRRLGASVDHSRLVFTMDEQNNRAVIEAFCRLHARGKIYRATKLVHWSYALKTAISSIEVDDEVIATPAQQFRRVPGHSQQEKYKFGCFHHFAYQVHPEDYQPGMLKEICVATTRLETMLGDCAVVVNPKDERYLTMHGVRLIHPYFPDRVMRVLTDEMADIALGTGAVKITPAHDENDFQAAKRLGIPQSEYVSIFDDNGAIAVAGTTPLLGVMRYDARLWLVKDLTERGLFKEETPNLGQILPLCSRSGDVVEPRLVPQWWVDCKDMANRACEAVEKKELTLIPSFQEAVWFQWLRNIQPWCVSRQLWWGHRIPAWRLKNSSEKEGEEEKWFVARTVSEAQEMARVYLKLDTVDQVPELVQDEDVLDTWFSSGLFPFASFGWPDEQSLDFKQFFPGHLLETGHDILFFWVARMVMMSLELTNQLPFTTVYLHAMVRDKDGRKMSKTLGNVVDPVDVMEGRTLSYLLDRLREGNLATSEIVLAEEGMKKQFPNGLPECGADALRFGLLAYTAQGRAVNLDVHKVHAYRTFCNKIWNIYRFVEGLREKLPGYAYEEPTASAKLSRRNAWILHQLALCVEECNTAFQSYSFSTVTQSVYTLWYYDLADVYVEAVKPLFRDETKSQEAREAMNVLYFVLDVLLRLTHPLMPFITEELWQLLPTPRSVESICIAPYPTTSLAVFRNDVVAEEMKLILETSKTFRHLMVQQNGGSAKGVAIQLVLDEGSSDADGLLDLQTLCKVEQIPVAMSTQEFVQKEGMVVEVIQAGMKLVVSGLTKVNQEEERAKLTKRREDLEKQFSDLTLRCGNERYQANAKPAQIENDKAKLQGLEAEIATVMTQLSAMTLSVETAVTPVAVVDSSVNAVSTSPAVVDITSPAAPVAAVAPPAVVAAVAPQVKSASSPAKVVTETKPSPAPAPAGKQGKGCVLA